MKCSTCGDQMLPLFMTYYCNTCDPRPTFVSAKVKEWRRYSSLTLGIFLYQILSKGDIIPKDAIGGWHSRRRTVYGHPDHDVHIMDRIVIDIRDSAFSKTLGWLLRESGIRLGSELSEDTLLSYDDAVLIVTKKL